ncbi:MAG: hypothetical protein DMG97_08050 [Acidobacteria bacterium]|nr:MAG: hypothetical protein DMG97_08050 [Acidobacteriota bacterium]
MKLSYGGRKNRDRENGNIATFAEVNVDRKSGEVKVFGWFPPSSAALSVNPDNASQSDRRRQRSGVRT